MKFTVRVHYDGANAHETRIVEKVDLDIRELSGGDAPLAVESAHAVTRWFEGRHYRQYTLFGGYCEDPRDVTSAREILNFIQDAHHPVCRGYMTNGFPDAVDPDDGLLLGGYFTARPDVRNRRFAEHRYPQLIDAPQRREEIDGAKRFADDCIVVDGKLWVACEEPRLVVSERGVFVDTRHWVLGVKPVNMNHVVSSMSLALRTFRLDDVEQVEQEAERIGTPAAIPRLTVHLPSSIRWDRGAVNVIATARIVLQSYNKYPMLEVHPEIGLTLFDMQQWLWERVDHEIDIDGLAESLFKSERVHRKHGNEMEDVRRVCDEWSDRPILPPLHSAAVSAIR